jgi:predicted MFS family arabinose efflux permease
MNYVVALLQEHTEPRMIGRVMSMYSLAFYLAMPLGYAQAGALTSAFGPRVTLLVNGAAAAALGIAILLGLRSVRSLD